MGTSEGHGSAARTLFLVPSANHAVQGEQALDDAGIACRLIPVPRSLSSQCGVCLQVAAADRERAQAALSAAGTRLEGIHEDDGRTDRGGAR